MARKLDEVSYDEAGPKKMAELRKGHLRELTTFRAGLARWLKINTRVFRWKGITSNALIVAALVIAAGINYEVGFMPVRDRTDGWRDYVWNVHGSIIRRCARLADRDNKPVNCKIVERPFTK